MAFFSVVIPTYNRANLIVSTIKSVLAQSYADYEIIIIDDGSTDNTMQVIADLKIQRLHYWRTENRERGHARNTGFHLATGDYVVFLDSDDLLMKNHLQVLFQAAKANPDCNFFGTKYRFLTNSGSVRSSDVENLRQGFYSYNDFLKGNFLACNFCVKKINSKIKLFEGEKRFSIMEDWMFLMENLRHDDLYLIDEFTVLLRDHTNRSMNSANQTIIERKLEATQWIEKHVPLSGEEQRVLQAYAFYFCAIHSYLDFRRMKAIRFIFSAIKLNGLKFSYFLLFFKTLIGKKFVQRIRNEA